MILALVLQTITLASQDYRTILIVALVLTLIADCCFVAAFIRGRLLARCASVVLILPTVFVVADFVRRARTNHALQRMARSIVRQH
jgi:F0F1-type ATP synthase assembly protein I